MRLKRLELYGYKSFASRTVFIFDEGITAIVGPNGSGKSNIADAVRWVMGEQSYTSMRAKTTEDMIFAGSHSRARLGMAEVILVFDNTTGWLPLSYDEVSVGRRAYRSGDNEYLLNGAKVRYRDILELFGGAGLARSNYTVISQGMVDAALTLRPEARRALFEEAAGVTPQLRKREETLQRIDETERNLQRVSDIAQELEPRVRLLQRQSERAQEQAILRQDLRELQRIWYGYQWQKLSAQLERVNQLVRERSAQVDEHRIALRALDEAYQITVDELARLREEQGELGRQQNAAQREADNASREAAVFTERLRLYESQRENLEQELTGLITRRDVVQGEVDKSAGELHEHEQVLQRTQSELQEAKSTQAQAETKRRELLRAIALDQSAANKIMASLADIKARLEQAEERRVELENSARRSAETIQNSTDKVNRLRADISLVQKQQGELQIALEAAQSGRKHASERVTQLITQANDLERQKRQLDADYESLVSRREMQARLRQELPGYHPGVREVLSAAAGLHGLLGTAASLMTVPSQYEVAIESALGPRLQNVVTETWADAEAAIKHLKSNESGWATFLPLDTLRPRKPARIWLEQGVVGVASTLVSFEERLRPVYELLLGSVLIVQNLPTARRLLNSAQGLSLIVTLGGETVQPSGAVSGGTRHNSGNLLAQEREWRELPAKLHAQEERIAAFTTQAEQAGIALSDARSSFRRTETEVSSTQQELDAVAEKLAGMTREVRNAEADLTWQSDRQKRDMAALESLANRVAELDKRRAAGQQEHIIVLERLRTANDKLADQDDSPRQRLATLETRAAVLQRTVQSQKVLLSSHRSSLDQLLTQIQQKQAQSMNLTLSLAEQRTGQDNASSKLGKLTALCGELAARLKPISEAITTLEKSRLASDQERITLQNKTAEAAREYDHILLEQEHLLESQRAMQQNLEGDLGPLLPRASEAQQLSMNLGGEVVLLPSVPVMPPGLDDQIKA
ncbi:MAG: chromosome segregation protein SMC, partial [Anaerolineae bacterium]